MTTKDGIHLTAPAPEVSRQDGDVLISHGFTWFNTGIYQKDSWIARHLGDGKFDLYQGIGGIGTITVESGVISGVCITVAQSSTNVPQALWDAIDSIDYKDRSVIHTDENGVRASTFNTHPGKHYTLDHKDGMVLGLSFQLGNPAEVGPNGWTNEALLAVLIHRTGVLNSQLPCPENEHAIRLMQTALMAFEARTKSRQASGVEGTQAP